jgi:hypothetical protein
MMKMKKSGVVLSLIALFLASCGRPKLEIHDSRTLSEDTEDQDPSTPNAKFGALGSGGNDAWMLNWYNWYSGGKANIPSCGPESVSDSCKFMSSSDKEEPRNVERCVDESNRVQNANFKKGYFLEKIDSYPFCQRKCSPDFPKCKGLECLWDGVTYAMKKALEWSQACHAACKDAIDVGQEFPYECRNLNEMNNNQNIINEIKAEKKALLEKPENQKHLKRLSEIRAEREKVRNLKAERDKAEKELKDWIPAVYNPAVKHHIEEFKSIDDKLLLLLEKLRLEVGPVQDTSLEVHRTFSESVPSKEILSSNDTKLSSVRSIACKDYDIRPLIQKEEQNFNKLKELTNSLLERVSAVGNKPLFDETKKGVDGLLNSVKPRVLDENILDGSLFRNICEHYRKMLVLNSLATGLQEVDSTRAQIAELIKRLDTLIASVDTFAEGQTFKDSIRSQALAIGNALNKAAAESQWNRGTRLSIEAAKALYLVFIPAIELNRSILPETKEAFKAEIKSLIESPITLWNNYVKKLGPETIILSRQMKMYRRLGSVLSRIESISDASMRQALQVELENQIAKSGLPVDLKTRMIVRTSKEIPHLVKFDDDLSSLDNILNEFEKSKQSILGETK